MIYEIGGRLQRSDFSDKAVSTAVLDDRKHEFANALSAGCILCILHGHASDEETHIFSAMQTIDPKLIRTLLEERHDFTRGLATIGRWGDGLAAVEASDDRVRLGAGLNREVNEFFVAYLTHLKKEEVTIVSAIKGHFTDDQMRAMRSAIMGSLPEERFAHILRWMLPSLTLREPTGMLMGIKSGAPPELLKLVASVGSASGDPARWVIVRERVGF